MIVTRTLSFTALLIAVSAAAAPVDPVAPQGHHEDVMIIFASPAGLRASYWDNDGHKIDYAVTASGDHVELLSDDVANQPRFKIVYDAHGADELAIDFAIKPPGAPAFQHYTGGTVHRAEH